MSCIAANNRPETLPEATLNALAEAKARGELLDAVDCYWNPPERFEVNRMKQIMKDVGIKSVSLIDYTTRLNHMPSEIKRLEHYIARNKDKLAFTRAEFEANLKAETDENAKKRLRGNYISACDTLNEDIKHNEEAIREIKNWKPVRRIIVKANTNQHDLADVCEKLDKMNDPVAEKLLHILLHRDDEMTELNKSRANPIRHIVMELSLTPMDYCMRCDWTIDRHNSSVGWKTYYTRHYHYTTEYNLKPLTPVVFRSLERQLTEEEQAAVEQAKKDKAAARTTYYEGIYRIEYGVVRNKCKMDYNNNALDKNVIHDGVRCVFDLVAKVKTGGVADTVLTIVGYINRDDVIVKAKQELDIDWKLRKNKEGRFVVKELKPINKTHTLGEGW